ncbi:aromatic ring-hydroxylating dioxygenase subunit alpha [Nocardia sp. NPDC052254]|uniref:aromatic ring-hydroxylating oxygenase subunit alpha n=1 Tax=Nocardia sp. NPDC052254 TaxID=3155681 RepID=UPI0034300DB6
MTNAELNARIRRLLGHLRAGTTDEVQTTAPFEPWEFTSPERAGLERDRIFGRVPSIVAHSSEIAQPNDFITLQMPRNRVIVVRQRDGSVKAFVNACRHRGSLLEESAAGRCRLFSCGYHRWSYDTDGTLRAITKDSTFGVVDRDSLGLVELPTEERHGFIWMVDAAGADIDVARWLGPEMDANLARLELARHVTFRAEGFDEPCNWKLMQDAFLDGYHIQYAHPNTAAKFVHTNVLAVDDFGRHFRFLTPRKSIDRWLVVAPDDVDLSPHVTETLFLGPNTSVLIQPDHVELLTFRPHPSDPGMCRMEMRIIAPTMAAMGVDEQVWTKRWNKNWKILLEVLHQEDFPLLRSAQLALSSADAGPLVLGRNEIANHLFRRELARMLA